MNDLSYSERLLLRLAPGTMRRFACRVRSLSSEEAARRFGCKPQLLTTAEVAQRLKVSPAAVRAWLRLGTIKGQRVGRRQWRIPEAEIERLSGRLLIMPEKGK